MQHEEIYLFDDQTEFIGSLSAFGKEDDPFSFSRFTAYAEKKDAGFYNIHEDILISNFEINQQLMGNLTIDGHIGLLNSPKHQRTNANRMHMYELRVGIQKNWAGPDWLGRWYRRNTRMLANTLKIMDKGDKLLIIVGDNHKWTLDMLFENTPDFKLVPSWDLWK